MHSACFILFSYKKFDIKIECKQPLESYSSLLCVDVCKGFRGNKGLL